METKTFSDGQVIKFGWNIMKSNFWYFFAVVLTVAFFSYFPIVTDKICKDITWLWISLRILFYIFSLIVSIGIIKISLKFTGNEKPRYIDLFDNFALFFKYLASAILYSLIVLAGFILLIVPGIIWGIRYQFFPYFIVDKNAGPVEALKRSAQITNGAKWDILGLNVITGIIAIAGVVCLVIGLFVVYPVIWVAFAVVYKQLLQQTEMV